MALSQKSKATTATHIYQVSDGDAIPTHAVPTKEKNNCGVGSKAGIYLPTSKPQWISTEYWDLGRTVQMDLGSKQTYAVHKVELNLPNTDPRHIHGNQPSQAVSARVEGIKDAKLGIIA